MIVCGTQIGVKGGNAIVLITGCDRVTVAPRELCRVVGAVCFLAGEASGFALGGFAVRAGLFGFGSGEADRGIFVVEDPQFQGAVDPVDDVDLQVGRHGEVDDQPVRLGVGEDAHAGGVVRHTARERSHLVPVFLGDGFETESDTDVHSPILLTITGCVASVVPQLTNRGILANSTTKVSDCDRNF